MDMHPEISNTEQLLDSMAEVSYEGITQWSIVYDMENTSLDFYWQRDYENPHKYRIDN